MSFLVARRLLQDGSRLQIRHLGSVSLVCTAMILNDDISNAQHSQPMTITVEYFSLSKA